MTTPEEKEIETIAHFIRHEFVHVDDAKGVAKRLIDWLGDHGFIVIPLSATLPPSQ